MADTGFKAPTANSDLSGASQQFQNRNNAQADNTAISALGTSTSDNGSHWGTFAAGVPGDATSVDGIEFAIRALDPLDGTGAKLDVSPSIDGGSTIGDTTSIPPSGDLTGTAVTYTVGGPTNLLGLTPTVAQINAANFVVRLVATSTDGFEEDASVEYIQAKIYYTPAGGGSASPRNVLLLGVG